ncbi:MAG: amidohydrolase family protein [Desulfosarcinaceae bacterium]|nr:amidohydrolase family protein [Desulfosarcinaceae bacterium]
MLTPNLPMDDGPEGAAIPSDLPTVIDAHVHVFPGGIFDAVRRWFAAHAWRNRYVLSTSEVFSFLLGHGVRHVVALQYAHKPGIARGLNQYMAAKCQPHRGRVTGMATVFPGEAGAVEILKDAFDLGLGGVKLHAHVQCFEIGAPAMAEIFDLCQHRDKPMVIHFGTEPKSAAYPCDPYEICKATRLEPVLERYPNLKICVPHLGFGEISAYREMIERHDNLWLDTTMALTDYFPMSEKVDLARYRIDRVMYGSDFPNIPFAWDRELKQLRMVDVSRTDLEKVLHRNAADFFGLTTGR